MHFFSIGQCAIMTTTLDLWMSRSSYDLFALVINFINQIRIPCHIIVGLFEALNIFNVTLTKQAKFYCLNST
jgi:hypothetical protein